MPSLTERFMGRPFRDTEWWIWWLFLPLLLYAWPLVLLFLLGRFALDMIGYAPSERRLKAIASSTHNTHVPVGDVYIPVGPEHNRPESEWWGIEGVPSKGDVAGKRGNDSLLDLAEGDAIKIGSALLLVFLLIFLLLGGSGWAFIFSVIFIGGFSFIFYKTMLTEADGDKEAGGDLGKGYHMSEDEWWDLDAIPVGPEHNRPESEWWDLEGKNEVTEEIAREQVLAERLVYSLTFLAVFAGTYALEESFWISVIVTTGFVVGSWALNRGGFSPWLFFPPL